MDVLTPAVSIIVPMYNAEKYIADAIQSVKNQTYQSWELLLVDDGSTDQTGEIARSFLDDRRIKYVCKENGGPGSARNRGIRMAKGTYLAFIDADDLWDAHKLETQLELLREKEVNLVFSRLRWIDEDGLPLEKNSGSGAGIYQGFTALFLLIAGNISIPNSSVLVERQWVNRVGNFNEHEEALNIEDYHLWIRLLNAGAVFYGMNTILGSYRKHGEQITSEDPGQNLKIIEYISNLSRDYPAKKTVFEYLILQRLSAFYKQHQEKSEAKRVCLQVFYSNANINSYWFERFFIDVFNLENYLEFKRLLIRRFRRYKTFLKLINT